MIRQPPQPLLLTMAVTIAVAVTVLHSRTLCCAVWQAKSTIELDLESPDAEDRHCGFVDVCRNTRLRDVRVQVMDDWDDDQLPDNSKIACWYFEVDGSRISLDAEQWIVAWTCCRVAIRREEPREYPLARRLRHPHLGAHCDVVPPWQCYQGVCMLCSELSCVVGQQQK